MSIEQNLERIADALERIVVNTKTATPSATVVTSDSTVTPKATRAAKAAAVVAAVLKPEPVAAAVADAPADDFMGDDESVQPTRKYSKDDIRKVVIAYQKKSNEAGARAFVAKFGTGTLGSIPKERYAELVAAAKAEKGIEL